MSDQEYVIHVAALLFVKQLVMSLVKRSSGRYLATSLLALIKSELALFAQRSGVSHGERESWLVCVKLSASNWDVVSLLAPGDHEGHDWAEMKQETLGHVHDRTNQKWVAIFNRSCSIYSEDQLNAFDCNGWESTDYWFKLTDVEGQFLSTHVYFSLG